MDFGWCGNHESWVSIYKSVKKSLQLEKHSLNQLITMEMWDKVDFDWCGSSHGSFYLMSKTLNSNSIYILFVNCNWPQREMFDKVDFGWCGSCSLESTGSKTICKTSNMFPVYSCAPPSSLPGGKYEVNAASGQKCNFLSVSQIKISHIRSQIHPAWWEIWRGRGG